MSEKFQIVESTETGLSHSESNLPFNRNNRIDNMIHWIYQNIDLLNGESIEHDLNERKLRIYRKLEDGTQQDIVVAEFKEPKKECCGGGKCCEPTN
jgi:hypothetical protein